MSQYETSDNFRSKDVRTFTLNKAHLQIVSKASGFKIAL